MPVIPKRGAKGIIGLGKIPVGQKTHHLLAPPVQTPSHPLGTPHRPPQRTRIPRLRPHLLETTQTNLIGALRKRGGASQRLPLDAFSPPAGQQFRPLLRVGFHGYSALITCMPPHQTRRLTRLHSASRGRPTKGSSVHGTAGKTTPLRPNTPTPGVEKIRCQWRVF